MTGCPRRCGASDERFFSAAEERFSFVAATYILLQRTRS
jgi:hypothetical protein